MKSILKIAIGNKREIFSPIKENRTDCMVTYLQTVAEGNFFQENGNRRSLGNSEKKEGMGKNMGKCKTIFISFLSYFMLEAKNHNTT